jgi:uncharacterized damage-inducible protein DinB
MPEVRRILEPHEGFLSREVALFVSQMDDQNRRLGEDTRGAAPAELQWQPARGFNTIGMLLAHLAIVEVYWMHVAESGKTEFDSDAVLGIGPDDDGMPIPEDGIAPAPLAHKDLGFYDDLLARARANTKQIAAGYSDADLDREWTLHSKSTGNVHRISVRWILYHILEHLAGHYGQINLLRHQYRQTLSLTIADAG